MIETKNVTVKEMMSVMTNLLRKHSTNISKNFSHQ